MADIKVKNLTFAYDGQLTPLFKKVNLNIGLDWETGITWTEWSRKNNLFKITSWRTCPE